MRDELSPIERGRCYAAGHAVDRLPCSLIGSETAGYLYGRKVRDSYFDAGAIVDIESRLFEEFGNDGMCVGPGLKGIAEAMGAPLCYPENRICYIEWKSCPKPPEELHPLCEEDFTPRLKTDLEALRRLREKFDGRVPVCNDLGGPFTTAAALCGYEQFLKDLGKRPERAVAYLDLAVDSILFWAEFVYKDCGAPPALAEPLISGDLLNLKRFRQFALPVLKRLADGVKSITGSAPSLHICGKTKHLWEDLAEAGFASLSIDNCESLTEFRSSMGTRLGLGGNVSPTDTLLLGTADEVRLAVRECVRQAAGNPCGYSIGPGCQIPMGTPRENLHAFMDAARLYSRGAVLGRDCDVCE